MLKFFAAATFAGALVLTPAAGISSIAQAVDGGRGAVSQSPESSAESVTATRTRG